MSHAALKEEALRMPAEQRAELADLLLDSLSPGEQSEVEKAWARESVDRLAAYRRGDLEAQDGGEVLARIRAKTR